ARLLQAIIVRVVPHEPADVAARRRTHRVLGCRRGGSHRRERQQCCRERCPPDVLQRSLQQLLCFLPEFGLTAFLKHLWVSLGSIPCCVVDSPLRRSYSQLLCAFFSSITTASATPPLASRRACARSWSGSRMPDM